VITVELFTIEPSEHISEADIEKFPLGVGLTVSNTVAVGEVQLG
jgi:hypothetical protein